MAREVYLSNLTVGMCFSAPSDDDPTETETETGSESVSVARSVMTPDSVWKVTASAGETVQAENALGEAQDFQSKIRVLEIPRQGFDRMVERANEPAEDG